MFNKLPTLYFNSPSPLKKPEKNENEKISYWLAKLHSLTSKKITPPTNIPLTNVPEPERTLEEEGIDEQTKNQSIKFEADRQSVDQLVKTSNRCIYSVSSSFPLDFFPSTINVEEKRVTFIFRQFLASQSHSVDIKDISNVFIESSLFYATLQIVSRTFIQNDIKIGNLSKKKAVKARMIIEGLRTLAGHNLDTSSFNVPELISKIEEIHSSQGGEIN